MVWASPCKPWEQCSAKEQMALRYVWTHGDLRFKLDPLQLEVKDEIESYFSKCTNSYDRLFVLDWARRLGKDFLALVRVLEQMTRNTGAIYLYGTAYETDLRDILEPVLATIQQDCPPELRLEHLASRGHYKHPVTGSILRLVGLDKNPDGLRGTRCDGLVLTEYAYIRQIDRAEAAVLPQLLENPNAWRILPSTPAESIATKWSREVVPLAKLKGNYSKKTLDECPRYSDEQKEAAFAELGGRDSTRAKREFLCQHVSEKTLLVVPEWQDAREECCVDTYKRPTAACGYVGMDPGMVDLSGVIAGYHDFNEDLLVIERAEAEPQLNTQQLADLIKSIETGYKDFYYFSPDGSANKNPYKRVCDRELRLIADLHSDHNLSFEPAIKHDLHAGVNQLRTRVLQRKIRILPGAQKLIAHLDAAIWNSSRRQFEHVTAEYGHFDLVAALVYLNRSLDTSVNPNNPNVQYPLNMHVVQPYEQPASGWHVERDSMGNVIA